MNINDINHELEVLKFERGMLNSELDRIYNKKWNAKHILLYIGGLGITVLTSYLTFGAEPLLIGFISLIYGVGVPICAVSIDYNKEEKIMKEIKKIDSRALEINNKCELNKINNDKIVCNVSRCDCCYKKNRKSINELVEEVKIKNNYNNTSKKKVRTICGINKNKGRYYR